VNPDIYQPTIKRNLVFEDLFIGSNALAPQPGTALPEALSKKPTVRLSHQNNHFSVSFIDLNPGGEENAHYFSKLEGLDKGWTDIGNARQAYFNNVPAGHYQVKVRIARSDQQVVEAEESFPLTILPAPWATWWAKMLYLLVAAIALWQIWAARKRILSERSAREKAAFEKEQEQRVNDMNMRFFANISHEFRTPLTMISGPVGLLEKTEYLKPQEHKLVDTIKWNAARMLKLVNQLMDFNKLENDALRLKVSRQDLVALAEQTLAMFRITMAEKHITLQTEGLEDTLPAVVDPDKVDKVLSNLLSNAVKYTPEGGTIGLKLDTDGEKITFEVSDNGPGIPEDQLERIFERYFQVEDHHNYGTGIGLYFARRLMELHHGSIHAENLQQGVKFIAEFPAKDIYKPEEHVEIQQMQQVLFPVGESAEAATQEHENTILLVDDDSGIVNYLKLLLSPTYNIHYAYNADGALKQLEEHKPDLILSDVAMPGMDGYELCRRIKADAEICHLPVILVTAKTTTDEQIAGLNTGADAYVTKPFDPEYLQALIRSQLENRARIRGIIANATTTEEIQEAQADALNQQDKALMDRLYAIMEEELSNEELNINKFTEMMYMSRTKLYYKIKGLTGETPNAFFKKYKLNRAAEMLKSGNHNISEVSDLTGFSSPTVFTRNFRAQFGMTPTEYLSQTKKH
jgi:signal transduction histidine kinase/DNA-binding response OmpR family regulator